MARRHAWPCPIGAGLQLSSDKNVQVMKRMIWIGILLLCIGIGKVQAQNDPVLAGMILAYTDKAQKELKNQEKVMLMQTTGHIWTKEEVQATTDLQREFNNYLTSFRSIVCYAAQTYGFYYEVSRLTDMFFVIFS